MVEWQILMEWREYDGKWTRLPFHVPAENEATARALALCYAPDDKVVRIVKCHPVKNDIYQKAIVI